MIWQRYYLDTNVLIDALLEDIEDYRANDDPRKVSCIESSSLILDQCPKEYLMSSPYALGEFIGTACTQKFGKSYDEALELAIQKILPRCKILHSKVQVKPEIIRLMERFPVNIEIEYRSDTKRWGEVLGVLGERGRFYSGPRGRRPSRLEAKTMFVSAPAFETLLFAKASEIKGQSGVHFADAVILTYVKAPDGTNEVDIVCSNDCRMTERWNKNMSKTTSIEAMSAPQVVHEFFK